MGGTERERRVGGEGERGERREVEGWWGGRKQN